jgi:hypothetical protein
LSFAAALSVMSGISNWHSYSPSPVISSGAHVL